jgi:hypothetical protein
MVGIHEAAKNAVAGFAAAFAMGANQSIPLSQTGSAVGSYFLDNYITFALGEVVTAPNATYTAEGVAAELAAFREAGIGSDLRVVSSRIEVASNASAACWVEIKVFPTDPACEPSASWTNLYGYRLVPGGRSNGLEGGWEWVVSDQEVEAVAKNYPKVG